MNAKDPRELKLKPDWATTWIKEKILRKVFFGQIKILQNLLELLEAQILETNNWREKLAINMMREPDPSSYTEQSLRHKLKVITQERNRLDAALRKVGLPQ